VVELMGGTTRQRATCQILPPNFQGYEPYCPYTREPDAGVWSSPDLDRARALIADAGAAGQRVTAWAADLGPSTPGSVSVMRYVVGVMNELGLHARLKVVDDPVAYFDAIYRRGEPQVYLSGWFADYPAAGGFIDLQFRCGSPQNASGLCNAQIDARIEHAQRLQSSDPAATNGAWIAIEHSLVDDAVWAPLTNSVSAYAFSARSGDIQVHPEWGILLSRLWVR